METRCLCCLSVGSWKWRRTGSLHFALADQTQTQGLEKKMHTPFVQRKEQKDKCGFHTYSLKPLYLWFSEKNEGMNQILLVLLFCIFKKAVFEESVKMSYLLIEKRPRKTKGCVLQRNRRHCNLRALMWLLKTSFLLFTTNLLLSQTHVKSEAREDNWAWSWVQREWESWRFPMRGPLKWGIARAKAEMSRLKCRLLRICS